MPKIFHTLVLVVFTLLFLSTASASASLIPCATAENPQICSLCDILVLGNNLTNWFAGILLPLGILAFGISGVLYLIQKPDQAKSLMASAAKGIIISLSAFLIVNITLRALDVVQPTGWNTFTCTAQVASVPTPKDGTTFNTSGDGGPKDTVGNPGDITGDPTITPTTPLCNEGRDTSAIPMAVPLALTLNCTNPTNIVSAIWRFPSDSNFRTQNIDSAQVFRGGATSDTITFTSIENPSSWNDVTVVVTDNQGRSQTYTYGFGGTTVAVDEEEPENSSCTGDHLLYDWGVMDRFVYTDTSTRDANGNQHLVGDRNTVVFRMVVTENMTTAGSTNLPYMYVVEEPSFPETGKEAVISRSPCNFQNPKFSIFKASDHQQGGFVYIRFNDSTQHFTSPGYRQDTINLTTGVWYFTVRNFDTSQDPNTKYNLRAAFIY